MIKKLINFLLFFFILIQNSSFVNSGQKCKENGIIIAYFNGIMTTKDEAKISLWWIEQEHGKTQNKNGEKIEYESMYNTKEGFLKDVVETINQRKLENKLLEILDDYSPLFFELRNNLEISIEGLIKDYPELENSINNLREELEKTTIEYLDKLRNSKQLEEDYKNHQDNINNWFINGQKLLFIAHSQGNLFANKSYNYARTFYTEKEVQVVHIAPASVDLKGNHILANHDTVINKLLKWTGSGKIAEITDDIPWSKDRQAGLNNKKDWFGHGLLEIYLNPYLEISKIVWREIDNSLDKLTCEKCREEWNWEFSHYEYDHFHPLIPPSSTKKTNLHLC